MHESIYCVGKTNLELLCESSHYDTDFRTHDVVYPAHLSAGPTGGAHTPQE